MFHENVQQQSSSLDDKNSYVAYLFPRVGKFLASNVHPVLRYYLSEELLECLNGKKPARLKFLPLSSVLFGIAKASVHFEKASTHVNIYFEPLVDCG